MSKHGYCLLCIGLHAVIDRPKTDHWSVRAWERSLDASLFDGVNIIYGMDQTDQTEQTRDDDKSQQAKLSK